MRLEHTQTLVPRQKGTQLFRAESPLKVATVAVLNPNIEFPEGVDPDFFRQKVAGWEADLRHPSNSPFFTHCYNGKREIRKECKRSIRRRSTY